MENRSTESLRVIYDSAQPGVANMAIDEAILQAVNNGDSPPTLRFYRWSEPTLSLGYFQRIIELNQQDKAVRGLPVVRRLTGGGAILHDQELTYSLVLPLNRDLPYTDIGQAYHLVHDTAVEILGRLGIDAAYHDGAELGSSHTGPFFCFARRHRLDLLHGCDKLLGSAQRRLRNAFLQHGALILDRRYKQQPAASLNRYAPEVIATLSEMLSQQIAVKLKLPIAMGALTPQEETHQESLLEKYGSADWIALR